MTNSLSPALSRRAGFKSAGTGKRIVAALLAALGLMLLLAGMYGYLVGDLQANIADFPQVRETGMQERKEARNAGVSLTGSIGLISSIMDTTDCIAGLRLRYSSYSGVPTTDWRVGK